MRSSATGMLKEDAEDEGRQEVVADLEKIRSSGRHLLALINDVLDLSKIEAGKMELYLETFDLRPLVEDVRTTVQPLLAQNGNTLHVQVDPAVGLLRADLTKVRQILLNLLSNATKFTEKGTIHLEVSRADAGRQSGHDVVLRVRDDGIGMNEEQQGRLFEAFSQAEASTTRRFGGTGLGLAITRRFCEMMGGTVDVESTPGAGSTFTIQIPEDVDAAAASDDSDAGVALESGGASGRVLVIDDEASVRSLLRRFLVREGFAVEEASSGEVGIALARSTRPDAITLDVMMPGMDGWEVLAALKDDPHLADIPVIMLTVVDDKKLGYALGAAEYLTKPIDREHLRRVLAGYRAGDETRRVLVVEDDLATGDLLRRTLESEGWTVVVAQNGREGLERYDETCPSLILLDLMMPEMDGFDFLETISAADDLETIAACIEAGAEDLLPKPFDPVILRARVSASVEKKRLRNREVDYLRQVDRVVEAAIAVERGQYTAGSLTAVAARDDAIGHLARVFDAMAAGVRAREERLTDQVDTLRREIDEAQWGAASGGAAPLDPGTLLPGTQFGDRYTITRVVGRGGMGTVYKAHDRELSEDIAIKLIRPDVLSGDPTLVDRFKSEIRLARRISHRNVVRTHDFGEWDGACYVTMEYVEGITVRDLIDMRGHLSATATIGVARQLAASLAVAHEQGVVHRDIKPQNLLLDAAGVLKVMDFGIARLADRNTSLTQAGMLVGTPAYMAPEQLMAEDVDARSDLYAAGVTLYECLTGSLPYVADNPFALIAKVLHHVPPSPRDLRPEIPLPLSGLVMQLMAKDADDRPASAVAMGELLAQLG
ncbi:MAG: response regulator [Gemmatimonadales bacterium]